jgi:hypothetical protein
MHYADHLRSLDLEGCTCGDRSGRRQTKPDRTCDGFLSDEISGREKRFCRLGRTIYLLRIP